MLAAQRDEELVARQDLAATRWISSISGCSSPKGSSISGSVKMPTPCTSAPISSSHSSMCDEAWRISRGPLRVPPT